MNESDRVRKDAYRMFDEGKLSLTQIAAQLRVSKGVISNLWRRRHLLTMKEVPGRMRFDREKILSLLRTGMTWRAAAMEMGCSADTIQKIAKRAGMSPPSRQPKPKKRKAKGAGNPARISKEAAALITGILTAEGKGASDKNAWQAAKDKAWNIVLRSQSLRKLPEPTPEQAAALVEDYIKRKGVTKCPPAYVAPVEGAERLRR